MPSGEVHDLHWKYGWTIAVPASIAAGVIASQCPLREHSGVFVGAGVLVGYALQRYINCDADLIGVSRGEGLLINHFGVVGALLFSYMSFYGYLFRRHHRSTWTHGPVVSTVIRYAYLWWWLPRELYWSTWDLAWAVFVLVGMLIGTCVGDTLHWVDDGL